MTVELVLKSLRQDENGEAEGETRSVYRSVEEALLQAAHNEMVAPGQNLRIEKNGEKVAGPADFKRALKAYREARNAGLSIGDDGMVTIDTSGHAKAMKRVLDG